MSQTWQLTDRRHRRSADRYLALRYQLEHTREKAGAEALVLADRDGIVVASSGDAATCVELGAVAPFVEPTGRLPRATPAPMLVDVAVRSLQVYGQALFLACAGGGVARDAHLTSSLTGVQRILTTN